MARKAHITNAPSAAQAWAQTRAVTANRNYGRRKAVRTAMPYGMRPVSVARAEFVDPETNIWANAPVGGYDEEFGGDSKDEYDQAVEAFEIADEYFAHDDEGFNYQNLAEDYGAEVVTPTTRPDMDTSPAPLTIVPTNTTNPQRPRTVAAGYDRTREVITVVFRDGTFYNYYNVSYREWQGFRMSRSKGRYIKANLDAKPRGYADATAVPVTVRAALYNVTRVNQIVGHERWQQPDLYAAHVRGRKA